MLADCAFRLLGAPRPDYVVPNRDSFCWTRLGGDVVGGERALSLLNGMLWSSLLIAAPVLIATLLVGLMVSVFQVTTQLQEITLSYVPKILVAAVVLIAIGPWMLGRVTQFASSLYHLIPSIAG